MLTDSTDGSNLGLFLLGSPVAEVAWGVLFVSGMMGVSGEFCPTSTQTKHSCYEVCTGT